MNPRDAVVTGAVRLHRMIRRGTNYGPQLPEGVLESRRNNIWSFANVSSRDRADVNLGYFQPSSRTRRKAV